MTVNRKDVPRPSLPTETVKVDVLGGEVVVQSLLLSDRLELATNGSGPFTHIPEMLSRTVRDAEGEPIFTTEEWEIFGAQNADSALELFVVAQRVSGLGGEEKKDQAPS